ncbi:MAG: hypothetical protein PF569_01265 [Candidatus Woesearchaeota archaeon]|nr:hypothetical protein [Candidatus Woesearchaeota archaeon]
MVWQDFVISGANLLFIYSLSNQVFYGFKTKKGLIALSSSFLTFIGLFAISFAFYTLDMYLSFIALFVSAWLWVALFFQRIKYGRA